MRFASLLSVLTVTWAVALHSQDGALYGPFRWRHELAEREIRVIVEVPGNHHLYDNETTVTVTDAAGVLLSPATTPAAVDYDNYGEIEQALLPGSHLWTFRMDAATSPYDLRVVFQGCRQEPATCFMPGEKSWRIGDTTADSSPAAAPSPPGDATDWRAAAARFRVGGSLSGFADTPTFLAFLGNAREGRETVGRFDDLRQRGILLALALVLAGGLALNLTPCVLPMIPINLAIIGAGAQAGSQRQGFLLGGAYGLGIMLVYGLLGVVAVLTGATFGTLNASPWFNLAVAVVFAVLALAMFDIFTIDFSRYQKAAPVGGKTRRGSYWVAAVMGGIAALLAGACVAPVVIAVLIYATTLHADGNPLGLLLPFVLGLGMALPWPFAGAGIGLLPRPGAWMVRVKQAFGVIILIAAGYYGWQAYALYGGNQRTPPAAAADATPTTAVWRDDLAAALHDAANAGRPVLLDFWASWCKNCLAMERTTLREAAVRELLDHEFVAVKYRAENPRDPATQAVLQHFGVRGLPTFLVLLPEPPLDSARTGFGNSPRP